MKRILVTGLVIALCGATSLYAQNNGRYVDDRYYNGSQAQEDADASARAEKKARQQRQNQDGTEQYNSSGSSRYDGYDGDAQSYNTNMSQYDDTYIDYDDDSYTTRMRRFNYPMAGVGYWGSVYSPYYYDPFFSDPFYSWGGWYRPGFRMGFGGGPYWNSCWGMSAWYGFGGFNYWGFPSYGYGWGGGFNNWGMGYGGYWNGYYNGLNDGRYSPYRRNVNYGPRGSVGVRTAGNYAPGRMNNRGANGMITPMNRVSNGNSRIGSIDGRANGIRLNENNRGVSRQAAGVERANGNVRTGDRRIENNRINLNNNAGNQRSFNVDGNNNRGTINRGQQVLQPTQQGERRGGLFNRGNSSPSRNVERGNSQPNNSYQRSERSSQPSRSFSQPAPSRSFSQPAPSRSSGGSFGGGSRGGSSGGGSRGGGRGR